MYEDYFGLERPPFKITPDTSLFYDGGKRGDILAALVYAIHRGEGIIKVVGEVGSGKTMLCRMLQLRLPDTVEIVYIANPSVSAEDILFVIAHELSLQVTKDASKHQVMHLLQDYLLQRHMENKQVVLFIEEAQGMPLDTLEEIRLLSNLETDENKLLQIILFGQPELDQNLAKQSIRQLRERITHNFDLEPLTQEEIHNYLNFRMREVGYTGPELISSALAKRVEQHSEGLLRRINIIADKILLSAFAEGTHNLTSKHVTAAVNDSAFNPGAAKGKSRTFWWFALIVVIALLFALYQSRSHWISAVVPETSLKPSIVGNEIAEKNDDSSTDNVVKTIEAEPDSSPPEAVTQVNTKPSTEESQVVEPAEQTEILVTQLEPETQAQPDAVPDPQIDEEVAVNEEAQSDQAIVPVEATEAKEEEDRILQKALDQAASSVALAANNSSNTDLSDDYNRWLEAKLRESRDWLSQADRNNVSIQVFVSSKSAVRELVYYLRNDWPLDLSETYLYEVSTNSHSIYRVFYSEFDSLSNGRNQLERFPETVKRNSPYLHSVYRMQKALL